jgi:4-alpha-glucanotransferase
MSQERSSGILLHPTSLPGDYGIGDFGSAAYRFIDFLEHSGQTLWQMLPLGPTGYGDSPYQTLLKKAYLHFKLQADHALVEPFQVFCKKEASWLEDFVLFFALKAYHDNRPWTEWPKKLRMRQPEALTHYRKTLHDELEWYRFVQFLFFRQFEKLYQYAQMHHVKLIGDLPIFVAHDSSDVWSHKEWFELDKDGNPTVVAGVPPDYFSETGQRWGNPLFNWEVLKKDKYRFWVDRFSHMAEMFDLVRIDHFHNLRVNQVVYTGTHDNDTVVGWWSKQPDEVKDFTRHYLNTDGNLIHRDMIRATLGTVCSMAIFPMQDLLGLGSESYMNRPGTTDGNWQWRMKADAMNVLLEEDLMEMSKLYGRT